MTQQDRLDDILGDMRKERDAIEPQLIAIKEAIEAFERLQNGGRKPRGRPKGSQRRAKLAAEKHGGPELV